MAKRHPEQRPWERILSNISDPHYDEGDDLAGYMSDPSRKLRMGLIAYDKNGRPIPYSRPLFETIGIVEVRKSKHTKRSPLNIR